MAAVRALALLLLLIGGAARAEAPDASLKAFLADFAGMVARGSAEAAKVTRFPLKVAVYQQPGAVSAAGFKQHFKLNSYPQFVNCLKKTPPQPSPARSAGLGEWAVDCDGNVFYFVRQGGAWRHSGFENVNE